MQRKLISFDWAIKRIPNVKFSHKEDTKEIIVSNDINQNCNKKRIEDKNLLNMDNSNVV